MNIIIIGSNEDFEITRKKLGGSHKYTCVEDTSLALGNFDDQDLIIDFLISENPENIDDYMDVEGLPVFLNIPKMSLSELYYQHEEIKCMLFGFNGLPGFFENDEWEVSTTFDEHKAYLEELMLKLELSYNLIQDRVGMVAPRVVCMIINEAFYTVMEGTASEKDIDLGMKLGTNYPYGPFEWLDKIGVHNVYELLEAIYEDTKDERYKIAPLLKKRYLLSLTQNA